MSGPNRMFYENLRIAWYSVRANPMRSILTILIISIGISALTGILTATQAIKKSIDSEFTRMGAGSFVIQQREMNVRMGGERRRLKNNPQITYRQAKTFKERFEYPAKISVNARASSAVVIKYLKEETDPNVTVRAADENYLSTNGFNLSSGRNFTSGEVSSGLARAIIGSEIVKNLFERSDPIGKVIRVSGQSYKVIGVLEEKGSSFGFSDDRMVLIPLVSARQQFALGNTSYKISLLPSSGAELAMIIGEAEALFRQIRKLDVKDASDFAIVKSDNLANMLIENIAYVTFAAGVIGLITLFGAAIGLMNIMLVSVSERTREIGTRKTLGANSATIKRQFLFESVFIGQVGGILGIILGILIGNIVSFAVGINFVIPWFEILLGVVLCLVVGILSGLLPAIKASKLDPIEALRYE